MNRQNQARPEPDGAPLASSASAETDRPATARKRCAQCGRPFGLVRRRRAGLQFCSNACLDEQADSIFEAVKAKARWYKFIYRRS